MFLKEIGESLGEDDERSLVNLLVDQIEFVNVIIVNKASLVDKEELQQVISVIKGLNPTAKLHITDYSKVELKEILNTGIIRL